MARPTAVPAQEFDRKGAGRLGIGAGLGFAGAFLAIVLPVIFLFVAAEYPGGFFVLNSTLVEGASVLVLAGAITLFLSLFFYRRSFAALRRVDPRFYVASVLCIVGSIGFLALLVAAALIAGDTTSLLGCVAGHPSHALSCLESGKPLGAITGLVGFLLGWLGGLGIMIGLFVAGRRFRSGLFSASGILYGLLLAILLIPFVALFVPVPDDAYLVLLSPLLALFGPAFAVAGSLRTTRRLGPTG